MMIVAVVVVVAEVEIVVGEVVVEFHLWFSWLSCASILIVVFLITTYDHRTVRARRPFEWDGGSSSSSIHK